MQLDINRSGVQIKCKAHEIITLELQARRVGMNDQVQQNSYFA